MMPASSITVGTIADRLPRGAAANVRGDRAVAVAGVSHDSRSVVAGGMFACLRGDHHDGHGYADAAVAAGATSLLVDHPLPGASARVTQLVVSDTRAALGEVAAAAYGDPSTSLEVVGVTGTNGKTTTAAMLGSILRAAGRRTSVVGTLTGAKTTPEAPELQAQLASRRDVGDDALVMEVSSHALALHRVDGTRFAAAVFTNLGRDHLDLHRTTEEYFRAKARLFEPGRAAVGVANADDVHGRLLLDAAPIPMISFGIADLDDVKVGAGSLSFAWLHGDDRVAIAVPIGGRFNVMNALAAATTAAAIGIDTDHIVEGLAAVEQVPGRFERVSDGGTSAPFDVIVDYAHTPDGLTEVLASATAVVGERGRVIVVFGAGGDRDREKRPLMGAAAAQLADVMIVTSDNPRSEDPSEIIAEVVAGIPTADRDRAQTIVDRADAIGAAVATAREGDIVVIAGKGHERTQTIGDSVYPFDDREVAGRAVAARVKADPS